MNRTFDRIPFYDDRSLEWPIRTALTGSIYRSYTWRTVQLDQGREGACTGFSMTMNAAARPKPVFGTPWLVPMIPGRVAAIHDVARQVYYRARQIDEWPGEAYEGSSVLAAVKAGKERGWWHEYRWALGPGPEVAADDVIRAVANLGPVVLGTWWWSGMMRPDADGYLRPSGARLGGHAYLVNRYSARRDAVWTPNSWGGSGQGWISRRALTILLAEDGEGCVALQRRN